MSKPLSKEQLIEHDQAVMRRAWLKAMRDSPERKCIGLSNYIACDPHAREIEQLCALGMLAEVVEVVLGERWMGEDHEDIFGQLAFRVGLDAMHVTEIIARNDGGVNRLTGERYRPHSFAELADLIESWFAGDRV